MNNRLTLNLGLRYDLIDGIQVDQSKNPNFVKVQAAGAAGLLTGIKGLENAGLEPKEDTNNWQPRVGFAYDLRGDARDVIRGGWGVYQDVGYTNSNVLFPAIDATGIGSRLDLQRRQPSRHPKRRRQLLPRRTTHLKYRQPEPSEHECPTAHRAVGGSAPADAVHASDGVRLVAPGELELELQRGLRPQRRTRPQRPAAHQHASGRSAVGSAPPGVPRPAAQRRGHASGGQPREERIHRAHHGLQAPHVERVRLLGLLHAGGGQQHDRHRGRRAQLEQHAGSRTALRRSQSLRSDEPHRRAAHGLGRHGVAGPLGYQRVPDLPRPLGAPGVDHRRASTSTATARTTTCPPRRMRSTASATRRKRSATAKRGTAAAAHRGGR